jgi:hypothetical protein
VETTKEKVLRIILAGQPELNDKLDSDDLVQLRQRVRLRFHLTALSEQDMVNYIRHRLDIAGAAGREIFEPGTFPIIFRYAGGIPRLTNTLCDTALIAAFAQDHPTVSLEDVQAAIAELQWVEYAARTHTHLQHEMEDTSPQAQPPVGRLVLSLKGHTIGESLLVPGRFIIGRTSDNDLQVDSKFVSRHHAQVVTTPEGSVLEDLNSTNGVYLNHKRVRRHKLADGDTIKLGQHEIRYFRADPLGESQPRAAMTTVLDDDDYGEGAEAEDESEA